MTDERLGNRIAQSRVAKATKLAAFLRLHRFTVEHARLMTPAKWAEVALLANTRVPSADTISLVIENMKGPDGNQNS